MKVENKRGSLLKRTGGENTGSDDFRFAEELLNVSPEEAREEFDRLYTSARQSRNPADQARAALGIARAASLSDKIDVAIRHGREAAQLYQMLGDHAGEGRAAIEIGVIHLRHRQLSQALMEFERGLRLCEQAGQARGIANAHGNLGLVHYELHSFDTALHHYVQAARIFAETESAYPLSSTYSNIALLFMDVRQYDSALRYIEKAIEILPKDSDPDDRSRLIGNRGAILLELDRLDEAMAAFLESLKYIRVVGNYYIEGRMNENIGEVHLKRKDYAAALESYRIYLSLVRKMENGKDAEAEALHSLASTLCVAGKIEQAEQALREAWRIWAGLDSDRGQAKACYALAKLFEDQQKFELAEEFVRSAKVFVSTALDPLLSADICLMLTRFAERRGDYERAYREYREHHDALKGKQKRLQRSIEALLKMQLALNPLIEDNRG